MRKMTAANFVWSRYFLDETALICYYRGICIASMRRISKQRIMGTYLPTHHKRTFKTVSSWKRFVVREFNKLSRLQRQALVLGMCWPGVRKLGAFKSAREAWESWENIFDMEWLLCRLGLGLSLNLCLNSKLSADDLRRKYPWRTLRARSIQMTQLNLWRCDRISLQQSEILKNI